MVAQAVQVRDADHLREDVFHDGSAQARHDVVCGLSVFLLGHDARVHEYRAAAPELGWSFRVESGRCDVFHADVERLREALQERAATRRAGLVHDNVGHDAVFEPDSFHVLATDVEHEARLRVVFDRGAGMGDGLHHMLVRMERVGEKRLAVACRRASEYLEFYAGIIVRAREFLEGIDGDVERFAFVRRVERVDELSGLVDERELGRRRPRVDAKVGSHRAAGGVCGSAADCGQTVALFECPALCRALEKAGA